MKMGIFSAIALTAALVAGTANADIVTTTFSGVVTANPNIGESNIDAVGDFGNAGTDLDGQIFVLTFVLNTANTVTDNGPNTIVINGGTGLDVFLGPESITASLNIAGQIFAIPAQTLGTDEVQAYVGDYTGNVQLVYTVITGNASLQNPRLIELIGVAQSALGNVPYSLTSAFTAGADLGYAYFSDSGAFCPNNDGANCTPGPLTYLGLAFNTVTRTDSADVPEPPSIAFMASGMACIGGFMFKRRRKLNRA